MPIITVFTPTFNRSHTLSRVYDSLLLQTFRDFEWLIVDDGSSDNTAELIKKWQSNSFFPIRYFQQINSGKHVAYNYGVREAGGELFLALDSDDSCIPSALERFHERWLSIPACERSGFSGITCLCSDEQGALIGGPLPCDTLDGHPYEVMSRYRRRGEMWGFHRTEILRKIPFPEYPGEKFVPEGLVWNRIGRIYKIRFINEALRCYSNSPDSLSAVSVRIRRQSPRATQLYYTEYLDLPTATINRLRAAVNLCRFTFMTKHTSDLSRVIFKHPLLMVSALLPGYIIARIDKWSIERQGVGKFRCKERPPIELHSSGAEIDEVSVKNNPEMPIAKTVAAPSKCENSSAT